MKLYNSVGPNPHIVRMFLAEKGLEIPMTDIDVRGGENRLEPYISTVNARGQCPALELDDGSHITEITAICEYIEEKHPTPPLLGATAEERGETRMWVRRMDLSVCEPLANGFRASEGYKMFKDRFRVLPEAADGLKAIAADNLTWLNDDLSTNKRDWICGDRFTLADILLYGFLTFGGRVGQPLDESKTEVAAWFARVGARPSAKA